MCAYCIGYTFLITSSYQIAIFGVVCSHFHDNFLNVGSDQFNKIENDIVSLFTFKNVAKIFSIRNETKNGVREVTHITLDWFAQVLPEPKCQFLKYFPSVKVGYLFAVITAVWSAMSNLRII